MLHKNIKSNLIWKMNSDIDEGMTFIKDPRNSFRISSLDFDKGFIWYIDQKFAPSDNKVWAFTCCSEHAEITSTKDMGYVIPDIQIEYSERIPDLGIDIDYPAYYLSLIHI